MAAARSARSHPRIAAALLAVLVLAAAFTLVLNRTSGHATSGGDPYAIPLAVDTNPDPTTFETTITAQPGTVDVGSPITANVHAETYNGSIPGPTLMLNVGDTVIVHFVNRLSEPTAIHWHGIEVPNEMDGTPLTQNMVQPDGTFLYKFKVTRPGIFWYHPHHHSSTNQVFRGLYGMIVVKDPNEQQLIGSGTLPSAANTRQIVLSDTTVCKASPGNDTATYTPGLPWVGPGALPAQNAPVPKTLCQSAGDGGAAIDENGAARGTSYGIGDIPAIQATAAGQENEGQTVLTNGKNVGGRTATQGDPPGSPLTALGPTTGDALLDVQPGQGLRLQILNASTFRYMRLRLTKPDGTIVPLVRVGGEGGLLDSAIQEGGTFGAFDSQYDQGEILLPSGSRADVVAAIPTAPTTGVMTLWTEDYQRIGQAPNFSNLPTVPVMHLNLTGATVNPAFTITGGHPAGGTPLRTATGDPVEVLPTTATPLLSATGFNPDKIGKVAPLLPITLNAGGTAKIDTVTGTHDVADYNTAPHMGPAPPGDGSTRYARLGDTLALSVKNATSAHHPFHLHGFSIQPKTLVNGGTTYTFPDEFRDNVDIPPGYTLNFNIRLADRALPDGTTPGGGIGRWVFHCHIFFHATLGMLSELVVLPPGLPATNGDERPNINTGTTAVSVAQGGTAQFTGTFNDPDAGDAVTLSSSVGSIADTGGGNYTWTFPTGTANSQYVYVTATDSAGAKAQLPVKLAISNAPPGLTLPAAQTVAQGANLAFNVSGNDPDSVDVLALTASGLPAGLTLKDNGNRTGSVSGQVTGNPGSYPATFTVNDGHNAPVNQNLQITVGQPVLSALVGRRETLVNKKITVGCRFLLPSISSCTGAVARGARRVGAAGATAAPGRASLNVGVPLDKATRAAVAKSVGGVSVLVTMSAARAGNATKFAAAAKRAKVVPRRIRVITTFSAFKAGRSTPTRRAASYLKSLARLVGVARQLTCTAHPDRGSNSRALAVKRAQKACAALKAAGLRATFTALGSRRTHNRRLELTILR